MTFESIAIPISVVVLCLVVISAELAWRAIHRNQREIASIKYRERLYREAANIDTWLRTIDRSSGLAEPFSFDEIDSDTQSPTNPR